MMKWMGYVVLYNDIPILQYSYSSCYVFLKLKCFNDIFRTLESRLIKHMDFYKVSISRSRVIST